MEDNADAERCAHGKYLDGIFPQTLLLTRKMIIHPPSGEFPHCFCSINGGRVRTPSDACVYRFFLSTMFPETPFLLCVPPSFCRKTRSENSSWGVCCLLIVRSTGDWRFIGRTYVLRKTIEGFPQPGSIMSRGTFCLTLSE